MNTPSPLVPQGATTPRPKSSLYFKILMILTVHVVVIGGMLLQGCKDSSKDLTKQDPTSTSTSTDTSPMAGTSTNPTPLPTPDVPGAVNPNMSNVVAGTSPLPAPLPPPAPVMTSVLPAPKAADLNPPPAPGESKEYVIAKGDTLAVIAHRNGLSVKSLLDANPGVNPKKLRVGQKIQIVGASAAIASASPDKAEKAVKKSKHAASAEATAASGDLYVVKSGDMLGKIAKSHGTTVKKIMALNELKTTSIRAGQKLKLPESKGASTDVAPASAAAPATASATPETTTPAPVKVASATPSAPAPAAPVAAN